MPRDVDVSSSRRQPRGSLRTATAGGSYIEQLRELAERLAGMLDDAVADDDPRTFAALARQYRETIGKIDEIEGGIDDDDPISQIIAERQKAGLPATDGKGRPRI